MGGPQYVHESDEHGSVEAGRWRGGVRELRVRQPRDGDWPCRDEFFTGRDLSRRAHTVEDLAVVQRRARGAVRGTHCAAR